MRRYTRLWQALPEVNKPFVAKVDLLIAYRNEAENLPALLRSINALNYPTGQLRCLFVNDHSEDEGVEIIKKTELKYPKHLIDLEGSFGKKEAIRAAWPHVEAELLVHTDADCVFGEDWLTRLLAPFEQEVVHFVSGPVDYVARTGFFHALVRQDFNALVGIGAAHIAWGHPMICNGANLAYRAKMVEHLDLKTNRASGDDVFLMQSIHTAHGGSVRFVKHKEALVSTRGPEDLKTFYHQRLRWASKNTAYSDSMNTAVLFAVWAFNVLLLIELLSFERILWLTALFMLTFKLLGELTFYGQLSRFFASRNWVTYSVVGQIFHIPYIALLPIFSKIFKYQWKGRKLK